MNIKSTTTICPICGDRYAIRNDNDLGYCTIDCYSQDCASNGGTNNKYQKQKELDALRATNSLVISVMVNGSSGIELRAPLSKKYNIIEGTFKSEPIPIFISPWMQFEPSEMNNERVMIAYEISHRVNTYENLLKDNTRLRSRVDSLHDREDRFRTQRDTTFDMWKADRKSMGLPEDFSDIKVWPESMMSGYV